LSEVQMLERLKEVAVRAGGRGQVGRSRIVTTSQPQEGRGVEPSEDALYVLASKLGLDVKDINACYSSTDAYEWCLALLGGRDTQPPSPFPSQIQSLLVKLLGEGKIDAGRIKLLGLDKLLVNIIFKRAEGVVESAVKGVRGHELASEVVKVRELLSKTSRVVSPDVVEEGVLRMFREAHPSIPEKAVITMFRNEVPPTEAIEEIVKSVRQVPEKREEAEVVKARASPPKPEAVPAPVQKPVSG